MDGITVLKTYDAVAGNAWGWSWAGFCIILFGLIATAILIYLGIKYKDLISSIIGAIFILFLCGIFSSICFGSAEKVYEPRYDVYIHGTINMDEFNEKYQVIKQDGLIYTITENTTE